jgi:putative phage-type endonuclease
MRKDLITIDTRPMSREDWLAARTQGIGGSDAGAIVGLNAYRSAVSVWADKTGRNEEPDVDNDAMRIGRDLEAYVASRWEEITGKKCHRRNAILKDPERPFMLSNVDRLVVGEDAGLEIKTASPYASDGWKDGGIPPSYEVQCLHYMAVTGAKRWYVAALIWPHIETRIIERDEETIANLIDLEERFWHDYVEKDTMPPADGSKDAGEFLLKAYPESDINEVADLSGYQAALDRMTEIDAMSASLSEQKEQLKQSIMQAMGAAENGVCGPYTVTWKSTKPRVTIDSKRLKKEKPEIWENYSKTGKASRRFSVKKAKEA